MLIEVQIRHENREKGVPLGMCEHDKLEEIIPMIERWGYCLEYDGQPYDLSGWFVQDKDAVFFEILASKQGADL